MPDSRVIEGLGLKEARLEEGEHVTWNQGCYSRIRGSQSGSENVLNETRLICFTQLAKPEIGLTRPPNVLARAARAIK